MVVEYTGRQTEVPDAVRELCATRLTKIGKRLRPVTRVHVTLTADKHRRCIAEVSVHAANLDFVAVEEAGDFATAVSTVLDKLQTQGQRRTERRRARRRRAAAPPAPARRPARKERRA